jgi:hypothetical protein
MRKRKEGGGCTSQQCVRDRRVFLLLRVSFESLHFPAVAKNKTKKIGGENKLKERDSLVFACTLGIERELGF